jgi:signal peptidase I
MNDLQVRPDRDTAPATPAVKVRKKSLFREYSEAIIIAVLLALFIRQFAVQAFTIPSGSMMDTLLIGDYILVNKFLYGAEIPLTDRHLPAVRDPHRGDIVVFKYPNDETRDFIKRIIAVGGDTVQVRDNRVTLNGRLIDEPYVRPGSFSGPAGSPCSYAYACEPLRVPEGSYFVMGDNRDNSQDSRYWGFLPRENVKGKALLIYWSYEAEREDYIEEGAGAVLKGLVSVFAHFFTRTRWDRMLHQIH